MTTTTPQQETQNPTTSPNNVCHIGCHTGPTLAYCGAPPTAWADCPHADYIGDYCKCNKPTCQLCEIAMASQGGGSRRARRRWW